jgi:hypothetical protein
MRRLVDAGTPEELTDQGTSLPWRCDPDPGPVKVSIDQKHGLDTIFERRA